MTVLNFSLLIKNSISYFVSAFAEIGSFANYALISDNSYSKIINSNSMILFEHDFWCHVPWGPTVLMSVFWGPLSCNSKVCQPQITTRVEDEVFWFDISMNDAFIMDCFKCLDQARNEELCGIMWEFPNVRMMKSKIASFHEIHN